MRIFLHTNSLSDFWVKTCLKQNIHRKTLKRCFLLKLIKSIHCDQLKLINNHKLGESTKNEYQNIQLEGKQLRHSLKAYRGDKTSSITRMICKITHCIKGISSYNRIFKAAEPTWQHNNMMNGVRCSVALAVATTHSIHTSSVKCWFLQFNIKYGYRFNAVNIVVF